MLKITPLIQERIKTLNDVLSVADFFFEEQLPPYDKAELIPKKGDAALALKVLESARKVLETAEFTHDGLDGVLRAEASGAGRQGRPDVSTNSRGCVRPHGVPSVVRDSRSDW